MPVIRLLLGLMLSALIMLGTAPLSTATPLSQPVDTTAPTGPTITPPLTVDDVAKSKNKIIVGVSAAVLLGIVIYGHRLRAKRRKKT
jgi:hypothetical protein